MKQVYLFVIAIVCSISTKAQYTLTIDDVSFDASTGTIMSYTNTTEKDIVIPGSFVVNATEVPVTNIGFFAFQAEALTSVTISSSVKYIGVEAFSGNSLTSVVFEPGSNIRTIDFCAFLNNSLTSIVLPTHQAAAFVEYSDGKGNTTFEEGDTISDFENIYVAKVPYTLQLSDINNSVSDSMLTITEFLNEEESYVIIPSSFTIGGVEIPVTSIEANSFEFRYLTGLELPNTVISIGAGAFAANRLTELTIPASVTNIGHNAFTTNLLNKVDFEAGSNIRHIAGYAFEENIFLDSIILPTHSADVFKEYLGGDGNKYGAGDEISDFSQFYAAELPYILKLRDLHYSTYDSTIVINAFVNNVEKSIIIPERFVFDGKDFSVKSINSEAFKNKSLISVTIPNSVKTISNSAFEGNSLVNVTIPNSVTKIGKFAFKGNALVNVDLPNTLATIEEEVFKNNNLEKINIPGSVTSIKSGAFDDCHLQSLELSDSLISIGMDAFSYNSITSLTISNSVAIIGNYAFYGNSLTTVEFDAGSNIRSIGRKAFDDNDITKIVLPTHQAAAFEQYFDGNGNNYNTGGEITDFDTYYGAKIPYTLQLSDMVFSISDNTLYISDYTNEVEKDIVIPESFIVDGYEVIVETIGSYSFRDKFLMGASIPNTVTSIGSFAFPGNYLSSIDLHADVKGFKNEEWRKRGTTLVTKMTSFFDWYEVEGDKIGYNVAFKLGTQGTTAEDTIFTDMNYSDAIKNQPTVNATAGCVFTGWDIDNDEANEILTFTAQYKQVYTVSFEDNDGTILKTEVVNQGSHATAPANPTRDGYQFAGWDITFDNVTTDLTITAQYISNTYTVTFEDYDGVEIKAETVDHGSQATAPADPTREGYQFVNWNATFDSITTDLRVTAQYSINSYTITFKDHDGTVLKTEKIDHGAQATAPADPTRLDYRFVGWDVNFNNITTDLTVTAQYSINSYTVTFKDHDGTVLKTENIDHGSQATAPADPTRLGYKFVGWDVDFNNVTTDLTVTATYEIASAISHTDVNNFNVYPNPASSQITITGAQGDVICIFNAAGVLVKQQLNNLEKEVVDISNLPQGIYMVKLGGKTQRLLIK